MQEKEKLGVVGAGRMGLPMVKHAIRHGYEVAVCDINEGNRDKARELGAAIVEAPSDLGGRASFVILGVGYDDEVNEVVLGDRGLMMTLAPSSIIAVSSTVSPRTVQKLETLGRDRQIHILDAPICRGRWFADEGKLLALFGGEPSVVERGRAVYGTFCSDISHLGHVGHGQVAKAMNNLMLWITSIGLIEAGRLAESTGIDLPALRDALMLSSGKSQALEDWDQTSFTWALKDMQIVSEMSDAAALSLPLTGAVRELVKEARRIKAQNPPQWTRPQS